MRIHALSQWTAASSRCRPTATTTDPNSRVNRQIRRSSEPLFSYSSRYRVHKPVSFCRMYRYVRTTGFPPALPIVLSCLLLSCTSKADLIVWKAEFPSPDLSYVATAETIQNGGFGSGGISTSVYIAQARHSDQATEVLGFSCD